VLLPDPCERRRQAADNRITRAQEPLMSAADRFITVETTSDLEQVLAQSREQPLLLYLHDPFCPISDWAYRIVSQVACPVALVDVSVGQELSRAIAARTGVRHASPQALLLQRGQVSWSASHGAITTAAINQALGDAAGNGAATDA
jgi:bacillithiol system protein YtxJ